MARKTARATELAPAPFDEAPDASAMLYVVKVGPIETVSDGVIDAYLPILPDGDVARPELGTSAPAALAAIAAREKPLGLRFGCAPELALAGRRHGFATAPIPKTGYEAMLSFALMASVPPELGDFRVAPEDAVELGRLARAYVAAAPWRHWSSDVPLDTRLYAPDGQTERFVTSIMGQLGYSYGFALYDAPTFVAIANETIEGEDVTGTSFFLDAQHDAAVNAYRAAFGIPYHPMAARAERGRLVPANTEEIYKLIAVARAIVQLTRTKLVARGELVFDNGAMVADVEAPEPNLDPAPAPEKKSAATRKRTKARKKPAKKPRLLH